MHTVGTLDDENIRADGRQFGFDQVTIFFARVVAGVENFEAGDVDEVHASSENVAGVVWGEADSRADLNELMDGDGDNGKEGHFHVYRREKRVGR